ncbi:MAG: NAD(P)-dependent oxidoreductase [Desulfovibrionaceae bacterium]|nr:NAD(P)-dependent oxidoreductase [Desulfovibrionaceae bacterium]
MKTLLVTGASGFLGHNICGLLRGSWRVYAMGRRRPPDLAGVRSLGLDLLDYKALKQTLAEVRPDAVIHAAALSLPNECQKDPERSRRVNVKASAELAGLCADLGADLAFSSSDLVFDGLNPPYGEDRAPCPISVYGEHKALAEQEVLARHPGAAVCRLALIYGLPGPGAKSMLKTLLEEIAAGGRPRLFSDEFRTPLSAEDAARGLNLALEKKFSGILHLAGRERVSRLEFGRMLMDCLGRDRSGICAISRQDLAMAAPRPPDVSLDILRALGLGFDPGEIKDRLLGLVEPWRATAQEAK